MQLPKLPDLSRRTISSKRWQFRQGKDKFTKEANAQNLKSRAAFKLLEINDRHRIFKAGQTVVDLGYAPGSWSQVAVNLTRPGGRVLGVDLNPAQPPKGVSTIQGNFLSPRIQAYVKEFLQDPSRGRPRPPLAPSRTTSSTNQETSTIAETAPEPGYIGLEKSSGGRVAEDAADKVREVESKPVDIVLSDMLMNTSGTSIRDHIGSMDLCASALEFACTSLKPGGHFVCKFYQGSGEKEFENRLKEVFHRVHREKPESSRNESPEVFFIGLRKKSDKPL
ncbi:2' O-ribose methyltransferase [Myotisia sp. PD_48]|nr:2' O-ribose methyltransferase [Myotisia sp. PD_48]